MSTTFIETALAEHERIVIHGPGEVIFHEGDTPRGIYVLRNGSLDLGFASLNGPPRHFRRAEARQLFGLSAVVSHCPHEFSAVTRSVAELGFIEREVFARVLAEQPAIWFAVLRILSTEVNGAYQTMRELVAGDRRA